MIYKFTNDKDDKEKTTYSMEFELNDDGSLDVEGNIDEDVFVYVKLSKADAIKLINCLSNDLKKYNG